MIFRFYCDLSYDGSSRERIKGTTHHPHTYVVAGITGHEDVWNALEPIWALVNNHYGVPRFHAAHLNGKTHEYQGWDDNRKIEYSRTLLRLLAMGGRELGVVASGMFADDYGQVISQTGRQRFGTPYVACFNSCVTGLARLMANQSPDDKFAVIIDKDNEWKEAVASFYWLKDESKFAHRERLLSCTAMSMDDAICLQASDLVAYEMLKATEKFRAGNQEFRFPIKSVLKHNMVREAFYDRTYLERLKPWIENTALTGRYLVHTPSFERYRQKEIPEELDSFSTLMELVLQADPKLVKAAMEPLVLLYESQRLSAVPGNS